MGEEKGENAIPEPFVYSYNMIKNILPRVVYKKPLQFLRNNDIVDLIIPPLCFICGGLVLF
jgi:hypothetical protein